MKRFALFVFVFGLGAAAGILGHEHWKGLRMPGERAIARSVPDETAIEHARRHLDPKYVCPMHPNVVRDRPGNCPICGMALVAREDGTAAGPAAIIVSPDVVNRLGVRTAKVRRGAIPRRIEAVGNVGFPTTPPVVQVTSPSGEEDAPVSDPGPPAATQVQVLAQVFERQAFFVRPGQKVEVRFPGAGPKVWKGRIDSVDPQVNVVTRTLQVRILADLAGVDVKPNMYTEVSIDGDPVDNVLVVPSDALIETGRGARVVVALGGGRFEPREVVAERVGEDAAAVLSGLREGEDVVVSAQFLLDSEASLQAGLRRLAHRQGEDGREQEAAAK
jgi:membrane fusion protein, copper/silver efflux system